MEEISKYLPQLNISSMERDLNYQINRRRKSSTVTHLTVNRLAKWSTLEIGEIQMTLDAARLSLGQQIETGHAIKLDLDLNTVPGSGAVKSARIPALFEELLSFGEELATQGDIP